MSIITTRAQRRELERENMRRPLHLEAIPRYQWPDGMAERPGAPVAVWRSRHYLVQQFNAPAPALCRLSVLRTQLTGDRWTDGIEWDELQRLKAEAGYSDSWAVEVYPAAAEVVNVANIWHLWVLPAAPAFAWKRAADTPTPPHTQEQSS